MHIHEKDISLFVDNSLDSEKRKKMEQHFNVCDRCRHRLLMWQSFYTSLEQLDDSFQLNGLEDKIMQKIKSSPVTVTVKQQSLRIPMPALLYVSFIVFVLSLVFEPVLNFLDKFYKNTMAFMLDEGLEFINTAKWKAVDVIAMFESLEMTSLAACVILIAGGIYFTANRKSVRKV